jgi:DNA-binding beta-propeller fold protein YncE
MAQRRSLAWIALVLLVAAACGGSSGTAGSEEAEPGGEVRSTKVVVTHYPTLMYSVPWIVGMEKGIFEDEGVKITEIISGQGGGNTLRNMLASRVPVGEIAANAAVDGPGFNANGVVVTPDGQHVIFTVTNSGKLYRVTPGAGGGARQIKEIAIDRGPLTSADGLEIDGHTLFTVRNRDDLLVALTMSEDYASAKVTGERRDPLFKTPTSVALAPDGRLLVANAEYFNSDGAPYYVLSVKRP